jgi:formylglycine-generating enzyme required for sulfatase activity/serine/threonine protein kinase
MAMPKAPHALPVGEMIEEFRIVRILGAGSFGIVYECENTFWPETAAIKEFLPPELAQRGADGRMTPLSDEAEETFNWARDRFLQEAKTLWELASPARHPNIVRVTRYCEANGTAYMFMEFERGRPLSEIIETQGPLSPQELDALFYPLLDGLERIHAANVLHRDIKPANILIRTDGSPVLIDFGAARRVVPGAERSLVSAYTPIYAALEQYHEVGDQGPWTDIYSFGATLYQAVTGTRPLSAAERLCGEAQAPVSEECVGKYPHPMLAAIDSALEVKPEDRPQSVAQWRQCLLATPLELATDEATRVMPAYDPADPTRAISPPSPKPAGPATLASVAAEEQVADLQRGRSARIRRAILVTTMVLIASGVGFYYRDPLVSLFQPTPPDIAGSRAVPEQPRPAKAEPEYMKPEAGEPIVAKQGQTEPGEETPVESQHAKPVEVVEEALDEGQPQIEPEEPLEPEPHVPGSLFSDPLAGGGSGPVMVWLPAGEFQMGSPPREAGRYPDERLHVAHIPKPFAVSETEITLGQYRQFVEDTEYRPTAGTGLPCLRPDESWQQLVEDWSLSWELPGYEVTDRYPVTCVSWSDAQAYADWLSAKTGFRYRLPTELEWEYAARADSSASRFWGDDPNGGCVWANIADCDDGYTYAAPAGVLPPNLFMLRDMLGNVAEWTCSEYAKDYRGAEAECSQGTAVVPRVFRGGSWLDAPRLVRSAARDGVPATFRLNTVGFRLVRTLSAEKTDDEAKAGQVAERR